MQVHHDLVQIPTGAAHLEGDLVVPDVPCGIVLFAHGSGSSRHSPRNKAVAHVLQTADLATLLVDLLTPEEEAADRVSPEHRFDIDLLTRRLLDAIDWLCQQPETAGLPIGIFGASTGAAAAIRAAAKRPDRVRAVVSRGGRPDLAADALPTVAAATLLIVGEADPEVMEVNRAAHGRLRCDAELHTIAGATHLFEEPGALEQVAARARAWFADRLGPAVEPAGPD